MKIWKRNWRHPLGELDIIALDDTSLVIIEVKTRRHIHGTDYTALDNLSDEKEKRLQYLSQLFYRKSDRHLLRFKPQKIRIDIVTIDVRILSLTPYTIHHYTSWSKAL